MNTLSRSLTAGFVACLLAVVASAKPLKLSPSLTIDQIDGDATFQALPEVGEGKFLCLWAGDALHGFILTTHEVYDKDFAAFIKLTERGMKKEGGSAIKIVEAAVIRGPEGAEVRRLNTSFKVGGEVRKGIYYVVKSETGYHSIIVNVSDQTAYDTISARTDKLMATLKVSPVAG